MKTDTLQATPASQIVQLAESELPLALDFRYRMMEESGMVPLLAADWRELTHALYAEGYRAGTIAHFGWRENGEIVATAGVMIRDDFPVNTLKPRRYGWIMDVYVLPEHRRHGHARRLTERTLGWLREHGVALARLIASEQAQKAGLYAKLGFEFSGEMRLRLA